MKLLINYKYDLLYDYAIGLATPNQSGILGVLDDIATADDAMHDVVESIEDLLKNLGFIRE